MFSYIRGKLIQTSTDYIIVENNNIGYQLFVPLNPQSILPNEGDEVLIHTYFSATENGVFLYGFFNTEDRELFLKMIGVSGIGPKAAISILSTLTYRDIIVAVLNNDEKSIAKAPGIGPKTARRMILDLKDKLKISEEDLLDLPIAEEISNISSNSGPIKESIDALCALGFSYQDSQRAVKGLENVTEMTVEEILDNALREL